MLQSASLRRSSYDRPWRAADTVGGTAVRLVVPFDAKLGSFVGQEHGDAADAKLASSAGRQAHVEPSTSYAQWRSDYAQTHCLQVCCAGCWHMALGANPHPLGARHRQRAPCESHRITFTFSFERYGMYKHAVNCLRQLLNSCFCCAACTCVYFQRCARVSSEIAPVPSWSASVHSRLEGRAG